MMSSASLYVTDTHSLLCYLGGSPRLSSTAREAFDKVHSGEANLIVPIIVIAEMILLVEKGRVKADVDSVLGRIYEEPSYEVAPLSFKQMLLLKRTTQIPEMHDRLIVCEALLHEAELITRDAEIGQAGIVKTVW